MKKIYQLAFSMSVLGLLAACHGHDVKEYKSKFRMINASAISGDINVAMDYKNMYASDIQYLNYSLFSEHISTRHILQVRSASGSVIIDTAITMQPNKTYSAFLYDSANTVRYKVLEENFVKAVGSFCKLRFMHLSNTAPLSDIKIGNDTNALFLNYANGMNSEYTLFNTDSTFFNAFLAGGSVPYYTQSSYQYFKPGYFYTVYLKGSVGSTGLDSLGFFMIENSSNY